jgi:hypothetical protein
MFGHSKRRGAATWLATGVAVSGLTGCSAKTTAPGEDVSEVTSAITATDVLGFEPSSTWTVSSGTVASSTTHTEGASSLAVTAPQNFTTLVSAKLASNLAGLAGLAGPGSTVSVDMEQPTKQPNPAYLGALQLYVSAPAEGVFNQYLGQTLLTGEPVGVFQTYSFAVTDFVRSHLAGKTYSDLTFTLALNAPSGATGTYFFDNVRTRAPSTTPVGAGPSQDVIATLSTNPTVNTPGSVTFTAGTIQIPQSFHVFAGDAGSGTATLALALGSQSVTCTYSASSDKTSYVFKSCNTANVAGDLVAASSATLTVVSADPSAALTKIKAQLAYDLLGDQVGTKLVPPLPTFWGTTPAEISAISIAFAQALDGALPSQPQALTLPEPAFAQRQGDGSPVDTSNGQPPPPNDPAFNKSGHLNNGGSFDAYWQVQGNLTAGAANDDLTTTTSATAAVHAVIFGQDETVADMTVTANTDSGTVTAAGFPTTGKASGNVVAHLFGSQIENNSTSSTGSFNLIPELHLEKDVPVFAFDVWVFAVTVDVDGILDLTITGNVAPTNESIIAKPSAALAASFVGSVDLGFANGDVDATVQLINVAVPITLGASWKLNQLPGVCTATLNGDLNGQLTLSSLGGNVTLFADVGDCPFCWSGSYVLVDWKNLPIKSYTVFDDPLGDEVFPLDPSVCPTEALSVAITTPTPGTTVLVDTAVPVTATATRPATVNQAAVDECQFLTWSSSDPGATFSPPTGCTSTVTFSNGAVGSQTITATATDAQGETGTASVAVNVVAPPPSGPIIQIISFTPTVGGSPDNVAWNATENLTVQITEIESGPSPVNVTVVCTDTYPTDPTGQTPGTTTESFGPTFSFNTSGEPTSVSSFTVPGVPGVAFPGTPVVTTPEVGVGPNTITCVATDQNGVSSPPATLQFNVMHLIFIS